MNEHLLVQKHGHEQGEYDDGGNVEEDLRDALRKGLHEARVDEESLLIVGPADEFQRVTAALEDLDLVEAVSNGVEDYRNIYYNKSDYEREYEYPSGARLFGIKR